MDINSLLNTAENDSKLLASACQHLGLQNNTSLSFQSQSAQHDSGSTPKQPKRKNVNFLGRSYKEEEMHFIYYHRSKLHQDWSTILQSFNKQFPERKRHGRMALQKRYYQFNRDENLSLLHPSPAPSFGVAKWVGKWYPWMQEEDIEKAREVNGHIKL